MKSFLLLSVSLILVVLLSMQMVACGGDEDRFSHAIFSYPTGKYDTLNQVITSYLKIISLFLIQIRV